jgi:hypothetical protein
MHTPLHAGRVSSGRTCRAIWRRHRHPPAHPGAPYSGEKQDEHPTNTNFFNSMSTNGLGVPDSRRGAALGEGSTSLIPPSKKNPGSKTPPETPPHPIKTHLFQNHL